MTENKTNLAYRSQASVTSQQGRVFKYLNSFTSQEKRAKIHEALKERYLIEALDQEGWRDREDRRNQAIICAEALKAKARAIYKMIDEENDDLDLDENQDHHFEKKRGKRKRNQNTEQEEKEEGQKPKNKKKVDKVDKNDSNCVDLKEIEKQYEKEDRKKMKDELINSI